MHGLLNIEQSSVPFVDALDFCIRLKRDGIQCSEETTQLTCTIMWGFCENAGNCRLALRPHISSINLAMFPSKKITFVSLYMYMSSGTHELLARTQICTAKPRNGTAMLSRPCFVCFFSVYPMSSLGLLAPSFYKRTHSPLRCRCFFQGGLKYLEKAVC